jgi:hypothetical protein
MKGRDSAAILQASFKPLAEAGCPDRFSQEHLRDKTQEMKTLGRKGYGHGWIKWHLAANKTEVSVSDF